MIAQGLSDCVVRSNRDLVNADVGGCFVAAVTNGNTELVGNAVVNEEHVCVPVTGVFLGLGPLSTKQGFTNLVSGMNVGGVVLSSTVRCVVLEVPDSDGEVLDSGVGKSHFVVQVVFSTTRADGSLRVLDGYTQAPSVSSVRNGQPFDSTTFAVNVAKVEVVIVCAAVGVKTSWVFTLKAKSGTVTTEGQGNTVFEGVGEMSLLKLDVIITRTDRLGIQVNGTGNGTSIEKEVHFDFVKTPISGVATAMAVPLSVLEIEPSIKPLMDKFSLISTAEADPTNRKQQA